MRRFVLTTFVLSVVLACQPATTELTDQQRGELAAEVELIHGQFWDTWRETDLDRGMSYYLNSPEYVFTYQGQMVSGYAAFRDLAENAFTGVASQTISFNESRTTVLAPDVVCITDQGTYAATDTEGVTGPASAFAFTTIWVNRDGEWKVHVATNSEPTVVSP
jgi:uncharacterized protein (TIGR02246 family)